MAVQGRVLTYTQWIPPFRLSVGFVAWSKHRHLHRVPVWQRPAVGQFLYGQAIDPHHRTWTNPQSNPDILDKVKAGDMAGKPQSTDLFW